MTKKILVFSIIVASVGLIGFGSAMNSSNNNSHNKSEGNVQEESALNTNEEITSIAATPQETQKPSEPVQQQLPLDTPTEPVNEPVFDPKVYAKEKFDEYVARGQSGMNWNCYENLMQEAWEWDLGKIQINDSLTNITSRYPSTCAAYANFKENGTY